MKKIIVSEYVFGLLLGVFLLPKICGDKEQKREAY